MRARVSLRRGPLSLTAAGAGGRDRPQKGDQTTQKSHCAPLQFFCLLLSTHPCKQDGRLCGDHADVLIRLHDLCACEE